MGSSTNFNQNNSDSQIYVDLYQCNTNETILYNIPTSTPSRTFDSYMNSCNITCCRPNSSLGQTLLNICQVTVQTSSNICLGRLCYSGECSKFQSLSNVTHNNDIKNKTAIMKAIHSSFFYIPWSTIIDSTQTKWASWLRKTGITLRHVILYCLLITNVMLTSLTLIFIIKSIRHANAISQRRPHHYTLL